MSCILVVVSVATVVCSFVDLLGLYVVIFFSVVSSCCCFGMFLFGSFMVSLSLLLLRSDGLVVYMWLLFVDVLCFVVM